MKNAGRIIRIMVTTLFATAIISFYFWTTASNFAGRAPLGGKQRDYYNLLVDGFRDGQLAMKETPDPMLGVDRSRVQHYLLDASFYRGRYYLYFGVTPALVLFLPWTWLTGSDLPEWLAAALLATAAYAFGLAWLRAVRREFFPQSGNAMWMAAVFALGACSGVAVVLRRPMFYEVTILSGLTWTMAGMFCLTLAAARRDRSVRWLTLASVCAGLAAGSRPTLIPGSLLALALMTGWLWWRGAGGADGPSARGLRLVLAAALPVGACLAGLAWYNWARFDNPLEFGLHYQLGSNGKGFPFTLAAFWRNVQLYYLTPPDTGWYFPFFAPGPTPLGSYPEQVHGQFYFVPLVVLAGIFGIRLGKSHAIPAGFKAMSLAAGAVAICSLVVDGMAPVHSNRYQLDFHPALLALVLALISAGALLPSKSARWLRRGAAAWLAGLAAYNILISFHVHGFFQDNNPHAFTAIGRVCDRLVWPLHRLTRPALGTMELNVVFPAGVPGRLEPLVEAGAGPDVDAVLVEYTGTKRARLVFDHQNHGDAKGEEFDLQPGRARCLELQLGTLFPQEWHPWYDRQPAGAVRLRNRISARLDGAEVLGRDMVCYQASSNQIVLGRRRGLRIGEEHFRGQVALMRSLETDYWWLDSVKAAQGPVRMRVSLPRDRYGATEPLVFTGARGGADLAQVTYLSEDSIRISVLHDGWSGTRFSSDIKVDYTQPHEFLIAMGSLQRIAATDLTGDARERGITVMLDGRTVLAEYFFNHPAEAWQVYTGCTPWSFSTSRRLFGGELHELARAGAGVKSAIESFCAGRPLQLTLTFPSGRSGDSEPLLTTGVTGRGDGLYVHYVGHDAISFGFDHWGQGGPCSKPVKIDFAAEHRLTISLGAALSGAISTRGRLHLLIDGESVMDEPVEFYPVKPEEVALGSNPIGLSTSTRVFTGEFIGFEMSERP